MDLKPWNPWQELERLQAEMDEHLRAFLTKLRQAVPGKPIAFVPAMDIIEVGDEYRLYLSLPGMVEEDIDITLQGRLLIVRGEREPPYDPVQTAVHQAQWKYGFFERRVELPGEVQSDAIQASYDAGVLTIRIPRTAASGAQGREEGVES